MNNSELANSLSMIKRILELQNDLYDFVPSRADHGNVIVNYTFLNRALSNIHDLNQDINEQLEYVINELYEDDEKRNSERID